MSNKIIFLDVDGPMIPARMYYAGMLGPRLYTSGGGWVYDPVAIGMVTHLCIKHGVQIVYNSSHNDEGEDYIRAQAQNNQLGTFLHTHFMTKFPKATYIRAQAIDWWLRDHSEVTHWVNVDDFPVGAPNSIQIDYNVGITLTDFERMELRLK